MTIRMDTAELKDLLKETAVFSLLSAEEFQDFAAAFEPVRYALGQTVFRAGDMADAFYVVSAGRARVIADKPDGEITVGTLARGEHLGEQGLLHDGRREF